MADGDTVTGKVRVVAERTDGSQPRVLGPFRTSRIDYVNITVDAAEELYINTMLADSVGKPGAAQSLRAPNAFFEAGESMLVQVQSSSYSGAIDYDGSEKADMVEIQGVSVDLNRGVSFPETLDHDDTALTSNPSADTSEYVTFFQYTVPDRQRFLIAGSFGATPVETT